MAKLERPKQKNGESDEAFAVRLKAYNDAYHLEMLAKQAEARVPRAVEVILSVANLITHAPNPQQVQAIIEPIEKAVAQMKQTLTSKAGTAKKVFNLPR